MHFRTLVALISFGLAACSQTSTELMLSTPVSGEAQRNAERPRDQDEERVARVSTRLALALASDCTQAASVHESLVEHIDAPTQTAEQAGFNGASEIATRALVGSEDVAGSPVPRGETAATPKRLCNGYPVAVASSASLFASTNGARVRISRGLIEFAQNDSELAFVLGHEMGHILRGDSALVTADKRFAQEFEADRVGFGLVGRAGYDRGAAIALLERLGRAPGFAASDSRYPTFAARAEALRRADIQASRVPGTESAQQIFSP